MPSITRRRYRLAADILSQDAPRSAVTGAPLKLILANDTAIEIAAFDGDPFVAANLVDSTTNWAQVIVQLYAPGPDQGPPAIDAVPVASQVVTSFSATTWEQWRAGTHQHAIATFTATEMNLGANLVDGHLWLVVTLVTTDTPARAVTLAKGRIPCEQPGFNAFTVPSTPNATDALRLKDDGAGGLLLQLKDADDGKFRTLFTKSGQFALGPAED